MEELIFDSCRSALMRISRLWTLYISWFWLVVRTTIREWQWCETRRIREVLSTLYKSLLPVEICFDVHWWYATRCECRLYFTHILSVISHAFPRQFINHCPENAFIFPIVDRMTFQNDCMSAIVSISSIIYSCIATEQQQSRQKENVPQHPAYRGKLKHNK